MGLGPSRSSFDDIDWRSREDPVDPGIGPERGRLLALGH